MVARQVGIWTSRADDTLCEPQSALQISKISIVGVDK